MMQMANTTITISRGASVEAEQALNPAGVPNGGSTPENGNDVAPTTTNEVKQNAKKSKGLAIALAVGQQTYSYATSNVGKWTGNSNNQVLVNNANTMLGIATSFAVDPMLGLVNLGTQFATKAIDYAYDRKYEEISLANKRIRAGYTSNGDVVSHRRYN